MSGRSFVTVLTTLLGLNTSAVTMVAEEHFYMAVFGSQTEPNLPRTAHTYAVFVRVPEVKWGYDNAKVEAHCISWVPQSLTWGVMRRAAEPGMNLGLAQSNQLARSIGAQITMWGPYRIKKELFVMALRQKQRLDRNEVAYICVDRGLRPDAATNCIHAVADIDTSQGRLDTGAARGNAASLMVLRHLERYIIATDEDTSWISKRLNLTPTEIEFATLPRR